MGRYPTSAEAAGAGRSPPARTAGTVPTCARTSSPGSWGNEYQYRSPGQHGGAFDLYSLGADNAEGGDGENQDVVSWL